MKITTLIAAATIASASTATYAGNPTSAGTLNDQVIILTDDTDPSSFGSLGPSGNIILPFLVGCLLLCGELGASGGS